MAFRKAIKYHKELDISKADKIIACFYFYIFSLDTKIVSLFAYLYNFHVGRYYYNYNYQLKTKLMMSPLHDENKKLLKIL